MGDLLQSQSLLRCLRYVPVQIESLQASLFGKRCSSDDYLAASFLSNHRANAHRGFSDRRGAGRWDSDRCTFFPSRLLNFVERNCQTVRIDTIARRIHTSFQREQAGFIARALSESHGLLHFGTIIAFLCSLCSSSETQWSLGWKVPVT